MNKNSKLNYITKPKINLDQQVLRKVRFLVPAQNATISPPIGPILGQFGINIMDFCKQFNDRSKFIEQGTLVFVDLLLFKNKSFVFSIRMSPFSFLVNEENFGDIEETGIPLFVNLSSLYKILQIKKIDSPINDLSIMRSFFGTVRSMHLRVCNDLS
jgi:large subunit ribosomal protein L11